jgi:DNA gyrase/topoisomerase IV subunit B
MTNIANKEIVALSDFEHVLSHPTMYVGSIEPIDESVRVIKDNIIQNSNKQISIGFYKLMNEILDNAFDEAKRMNGRMQKITISFDSKSKKVSVTDTGDGFLNGSAINKKTGLSNIETAMSMLRAGSNFSNQNLDNTVLGTHGVGAAVVNMLSSVFEVTTICEKEIYYQRWENYKSVEKTSSKRKSEPTGTTISFVPRPDKFEKCYWDFDYIESQMIFKDFIRRYDDNIKNLIFEVYCDGIQLNLNKQFIPDNHFIIDSKIGQLIVWEHYENGTKSTSFVNTALCNGIHLNIINDTMNEIFNYKWSYAYYDFLLIMNIPPKHVRFGDQNKTKFAVGRWEIEPIMEKHFIKDLQKLFPKTDMFKRLSTKIKEKIDTEEIQGLKRAIRSSAKKIISDKYFPPSVRKGTLFIVEGGSAQGGISQKRNTESDGIYSLKGKIKNARTVSDLTNNTEIIDLINILGLDPNNTTKCNYDKVIIAVDADPDGGHIASLLINLFYKWFKFVIEKDKLFMLITPLVSVDVGKDRKYFFTMKEYATYTTEATEKYSNIRYLKGLGSLAPRDWENVMRQRDCYRIYMDRSAGKFLWMAFDANASYRKRWLEGTI